MKTSSDSSSGLYFLSGGGEMGELTRKHDWSQTALGGPEHWPQSLRLTLSMLLSSKFPMFLWWGEDLVQFYNDAYRPSLGNNGKHPLALGQNGKDCWPEIWDIIYPLIRQVRETGQATWSEDQLIPIYRNGKIEDVYWTFGYSPIYGDKAGIEGVLVVCTETTEKVHSLIKLTHSKDELKFAIDAAELATYDYNPKTNKFMGNERLKDWFGISFESEIDLSVAMEAIVEKDRDTVTRAIQDSLVYESGGKYDIEYTVRNAHSGVERVIRARGKCSFDEQKVPYRLNGTLQDITRDTISRKKEEEERLRRELAIAAGEFGVFEVDLSTNIVIADDRFNAIYGFSETADRDTYLATCHPDDLPIRDQALKEGMAKGSFDFEIRFTHRDGTERWMRFKGRVTYDRQGAPVRLTGINQDITERKWAEQRMKESEQQMRTMVENAPFPIGVYIGREMRVEFANQSIIDIWGKGNDVIGKSFRDILPELDNQEVFKQVDEVFTTGIPFHIKNQRLELIVNGKARPYYFNYSFTPLFDTSGRVYGVMNTGVDLTDLHLAQQAIKKSEENLRNIITQAPVAMCMFRGPEHVVELANDRMFELWGRPSEDVLEKPIFEGLPEAKDQGFEDMLDSVYATGQTYFAQAVPVTLPRNNGLEKVYVNFVYEAYRQGDGLVSGILAVAVDITPQVIAHQKIEEEVSKRTEELASANDGLQKSNAELAQFAYIASHDLQEPLRKISTYTQMLENRLGSGLDEKSASHLQKIKNASSRMTALIRDVLAYSELVKDNEMFTEVDLNQVLKNTIVDYELLIEQKGAIVQSAELPVIEAIPLQMSQLFGNIIGNSLKYVRQDLQPVLSISVSATSEKEKLEAQLDTSLDYVSIRFSDNGIGFREEYADQIFSIFQRLHRKSEFEGTGIGLAICKKIAQNHFGSINAYGSSEKGAVFNVILPLRK